MAKAIAMFIAAGFALLSMWGFFFHFSAGPSHGPGLELGVLAGGAALIAGYVAVTLRSREPD